MSIRSIQAAPPRAIATPPSPPTPRGRGRRLAVVLALATAVASVAVPVFMPPARAVTTTITVNSPAYGGRDITPGNGVCETATGNGNCTLRAAIEESNALNRPAGEVLINVATTINPNTKMTGSLNSSGNFMSSTSINRQDGGVQFVVSAPVIIDLGHRLQPDAGADDGSENAMFYLTGSDIQILNADNVMSSGSSFVIGATARNITINGDTMGTNGGFGTMYASSWGPERFVVVMQGAQNVYVANYMISGYYDSNADGGIFVFATTTASAPANITQNIVFENIQVTNQNTGSCSGSSATGCNARVLTFWQGSNSGTNQDSYQYNVINGLTFRGIVINFLSQAMYGFQFANPSTSPNNQSSDITNLTIENCRFLRMTPTSNSQQNAFIVLPYGAYLHGTNAIRNNVITSPTTTSQGGTATAIYFVGTQPSGSTYPTNLAITGNHFNGFGGSGTIRTRGVGLVTVSGNTFGTATKSYANANEETTDTNVMYSFAGATSAYTSTNQAIVTWSPAVGNATVLTGAAPGGAVPVQPLSSPAQPTCPATLTVNKPTSAPTNYTVPADPVTLDVYWTGSQTAEVYLGQATGLSGPSATLVVPVPVGAVTLPDGTSVTPINATTGVATGNLRVQTQVQNPAQPESSQYSHTVTLAGTCVFADVTAVSPAQGPVAGGTTMTVTGSGFSNLQGGSSVALTFGDAACTNPTIIDDTTLTCSTPAHTAGPTAVAVAVNGQALAFSATFLYYTSPVLSIAKHAWLDVPPGATHDDIVGGRTAARGLPLGAILPPGQTVTWTYTVSSKETGADPSYGADASRGQGSFDISVDDDMLGHICTIASLDPNSSVGCVASGEVQPA